jgi:hypothetical protein
VNHLVVVRDLIRVIFWDLDHAWLKSIWEIGGATCQDMVEIIFMLYLVKSRL